MMYAKNMRTMNFLGWTGPFLLLTLGLVILQFRVGLWSIPPQQQEWFEAEDIAETIPVTALRSAIEQADYEWGPENDNTLLLFAIGDKVCYGSLVEIDEFADLVQRNFAGATDDDRITPLVLSLSDSFPLAKRFAKVTELSVTTVPTSDPDLLKAFGFWEDRTSRQIIVLIDSQNGRVLRHAFISSSPTPVEDKLSFLNLDH